LQEFLTYGKIRPNQNDYGYFESERRKEKMVRFALIKMTMAILKARGGKKKW